MLSEATQIENMTRKFAVHGKLNKVGPQFEPDFPPHPFPLVLLQGHIVEVCLLVCVCVCKMIGIAMKTEVSIVELPYCLA